MDVRLTAEDTDDMDAVMRDDLYRLQRLNLYFGDICCTVIDYEGIFVAVGRRPLRLIENGTVWLENSLLLYTQIFGAVGSRPLSAPIRASSVTYLASFRLPAWIL